MHVADKLQYFATEQLGPKRRLTPEGFLLCEDVPIARIGMQLYAEGEVPVPADIEGHVQVDRHPEDVFRPETIASANRVIALHEGRVAQDLRAVQTEIPAVRWAAPVQQSRASLVGDDQNWSTQVSGTTPDYFSIRFQCRRRGFSLGSFDDDFFAVFGTCEFSLTRQPLMVDPILWSDKQPPNE